MLEKEVKVHTCGSIIWSSMKLVTFPSTLPSTFCIFSFVLDGQVHEFFKIFRVIFNTFCIFSFVFDMQNGSKNRRKIVPWGRLEAPREPSRGLPEAVHRRFQSQLTMNERNERFWEFPGSSQETPGDPGKPQKFT